MNDENQIVKQVYEAKDDMIKADEMILNCMPFIKSETAKFMKRPPIEGQDDELSISMIAFHEAICSYSMKKGTFFKFASLLIKNRLIDYVRKESRHKEVVSLDVPIGDEKKAVIENIDSGKNHSEDIVMRNATRMEIEELSRQMQEFDVTLNDVADNCPRQKRTLTACQKVLDFARKDKELMNEFLRTKRLPIAKLVEGSGIERKTLERHRKYVIALMLIYTNGYEIIRGHIQQIAR